MQRFSELLLQRPGVAGVNVQPRQTMRAFAQEFQVFVNTAGSGGAGGDAGGAERTVRVRRLLRTFVLQPSGAGRWRSSDCLRRGRCSGLVYLLIPGLAMC